METEAKKRSSTDNVRTILEKRSSRSLAFGALILTILGLLCGIGARFGSVENQVIENKDRSKDNERALILLERRNSEQHGKILNSLGRIEARLERR